MLQPKPLSKCLLAAAVFGTVVAAAPRVTAVRLDCPVLPLRVWCHPNDCKNAGCVVYYCERLWTWDEYHFVVDIKADSIDPSGARGPTASIQMVDTPHVGLVTPTPAPASNSTVSLPSSQISDAALAWSAKMGGNDTSFVLWRDTLALDVTTVSPAQIATTPQSGSPPPTATPTPSVTVLWHGTCVAAKQQLPAVTPSPKPAPALIPVSVFAQVKALKTVPRCSKSILSTRSHRSCLLSAICTCEIVKAIRWKASAPWHSRGPSTARYFGHILNPQAKLSPY